jgi:serine/threonine protein kinase/WD40 repeat protein
MLAAHDAPNSLFDNSAQYFSPTVDQPTREIPGVSIGPYKLIDPIGEGGMGTVWMAQQTEPVKRLVAVKLIKAGMDSKQVIARFEAERQALALMDHPNIARVLDAGTTDAGRPYFVMDLVKGVSITKYCDEHHLTPRQRLELCVPVCQAIQHAHTKGIIHRDLKPSNVLVALYDGRPVPKVIDFGVAKAAGQPLTDRTLVTGFGAIVGTLEYMSPEQAEINQLDIDTRSDIYSLGVLLYELLTGSTPFTKKDLEKAGMLEMLRVIREQEPSRPSTKLSTADGLPTLAANRGTEPAKLVRGELDWIVMKALEKDRNRRYETANGFAMDVQRYLADEPVQACPPSVGYRLRKFARRNRMALVMGSVILVALLTSVVTLAISNSLVRNEQRETAQALEQTKIQERKTSEQLWQSLVAQARGIQMSRRAGQRFQSLEILGRATELARSLNLPEENFHELRNAIIGALSLIDLHLSGPGNPWPADGMHFDFDESHERYARTDYRGNCSVRRVADDAELYQLPGLGSPSVPYFSDDGQFLVVAHRQENGQTPVVAKLWDLQQPIGREIWSGNEGREGRTAFFHPNEQKVALTYSDGAIALFELPTGKQLNRLDPIDLIHPIGIALHPTEPLVAICSYDHPQVQVRNLRTGKVVASLRQESHPDSIAWHPDGRILAVGLAEACQIHLYDLPTRDRFRTISLNQTASGIAFNHAGDRLASTGWGERMELIDVGTGQNLMMTKRFQNARRFSQSDRQLAGGIQDGKLGIWEVADSRECRTLVRQLLPEKVAYTHSLSVSPDGRILAVAMTDGFSLWDLADGGELAFIPTGGTNTLFHFEQTGALLALTPAGLFRWQMTKASGAELRVVMGPPQQLRLPRGSYLGQSDDGRVIVTCARTTPGEREFAGAWVLHADRPDKPLRIDQGADIDYIAVSPDGRLVVTVANDNGPAKIWDARDGNRSSTSQLGGPVGCVSAPMANGCPPTWMVVDFIQLAIGNLVRGLVASVLFRREIASSSPCQPNPERFASSRRPRDEKLQLWKTQARMKLHCRFLLRMAPN